MSREPETPESELSRMISLYGEVAEGTNKLRRALSGWPEDGRCPRCRRRMRLEAVKSGCPGCGYKGA